MGTLAGVADRLVLKDRGERGTHESGRRCQIVWQAKSGDRLFNKVFFACLACLQAQFAGAARADHAGRQAAPQARFLPESPT